ncbi:MAG: hypothetical protein HC854_03955 [Flavobacterium sp.]|nr:hypothetical protein [Flavobacterium sp.]
MTFSSIGNKKLDDFVNNSLIEWKIVEQRPGATAILEGTLEGKIIQITNYTTKGLSKSQIRAQRHKLVDDWLENIASSILKNRRNHGRCVEPVNISEWLFKAEKALGIQKNSMKIEQARALFSDVISKAKRIHNSTESQLAHGLNKSACDSCNPLLEYFNIKEIF